MTTYAAAKAFVLSFSEALWEENRAHGIQVMALCPGVTETGFFTASKMDRPPARVSQTPEEVVDTALRALKRGKSHVISGWTNFFTTESERLMPRSVVLRLVGSIMRGARGGKKNIEPQIRGHGSGNSSGKVA
jgi:short-subunit dehydrogenase